MKAKAALAVSGDPEQIYERSQNAHESGGGETFGDFGAYVSIDEVDLRHQPIDNQRHKMILVSGQSYE